MCEWNVHEFVSVKRVGIVLPSWVTPANFSSVFGAMTTLSINAAD